MREYYLQKAEENLPHIYREDIPLSSEETAFCTGDSFVLDLGNHYVGYFSFAVGYTSVYPDAPVRLCVKFCECRDELDADFSAYKGRLSPTWLQEEIIHIDSVGAYQMPRRYAARYIKIRVLYTPRQITLSQFLFTAVTSADKRRLTAAELDDPALQAIDAVSVNTLKNCMQRVFEDGPKRDRRLWIGDLRLEALTNYETYGQNELVRRCLYLFASADCDSTGFLPGYVYESPVFVSGYWFLRDYALLFVVALCDYYLHTGDEKTFADLYPVAKKQMEAAQQETDQNGIFAAREQRNAFIDWEPALKKTTALHGVYLYTLDILHKTLVALNHEDAAVFGGRYHRAKQAALLHLYNQKENNFSNAYDSGQISVHSAVWMILGGVQAGENAWAILQQALESNESIQAVTPYMHHYLVEAMIKLGKTREAFDHIKNFWGRMVRQGADTFHEVFVPGDPDASPYGDKLMNSMCHAWSCTPAYFIRKQNKL